MAGSCGERERERATPSLGTDHNCSFRKGGLILQFFLALSLGEFPSLGSQHPSPNVQNPLQSRDANLVRHFSYHVMPKVLVLKARDVM